MTLSFDELREYISKIGISNIPTSQRVLQTKKYKELYNNILEHTKYLPLSSKASTRITCISKGYRSIPKCMECDNITKWSNGDFRLFCSRNCSDSSKHTIDKRKQTTLNRYGTQDTYNTFKEKRDKTVKEKYGSEEVMQSARLDKTKRHNMEKYGVEYGFQREEVKDKIKKTLEIKYDGHHLSKPEGMEKLKKTNLEKYGVEYQTQRANIREKIKKTNLNKYGVECPLQTDKAQYNLKQVAKDLNVDHHTQSSKVKKKRKKTSLKKYGYEHPLQNPNIFKKQKKTNLKKYGKEFCGQIESHKQKIKNTNIKRYGGSTPMANKKIRDKTKKTLEKKYGVGGHTNNKKWKFQQKQRNKKKYNKNWYIETADFNAKKDATNKKKYGTIYPSQTKLIKERTKKTNLKKYGSPHKKKQHLTLFGMPLLTDNEYFINMFNKHGLEELIILSGYESRDSLVSKAYELNLINKVKSSGEMEVYDYICSLGIGKLIENDRTLINPYELDIVIPDKKIAIEYCGLYWHSEKHKDRNYHKTKTEMCRNIGYQLITIFENEWINRKKQCKDRLRSLLQCNETIFGRNTDSRLINKKDATEFMDNIHLQGSPPVSSINIGLYYNDNLVSVMSFINRKNEYELVRYCSKYNIVGGASKLLSYFKKNYDWKSIKTFADLRWTTGSFYTDIGFKLDKILSPDYYYTKGKKLEHKFNHRKKKYAQKYNIDNMTEKEIMVQENWNRIYDCGKLRFIVLNE